MSKYYVDSENHRNAKARHIFEKLLQLAFGHEEEVIPGHHFMLMNTADPEQLQEIPSADTAIFDHDIMKKVFGSRAIGIMQTLAGLPVEGGHRDAKLLTFLEELPYRLEQPQDTVVRLERHLYASPSGPLIEEGLELELERLDDDGAPPVDRWPASARAQAA